MKKAEKKQEQKLKDSARSEELIHKLKATNKLNEIEKIELRRILNEYGKKVDPVTAEYIGLKKPKSKGWIIGFSVLLLLFLALGSYTAWYVINSRKQIKQFSTELNAQINANKELGDSNEKQSQTIFDLNEKVNSLQTQLDQKPTTVYVPQVPTYHAPTYTTCNDNFLGGFNCSSF